MTSVPYYSDDLVTLYHGDCLDVLPTLDPIDLVLTSPPYNLSGDGARPRGTYLSTLDGGYDTHADNLPHPKYVEWQHDVLSACWERLAPGGAIFYNHKPIPRDGATRLPFDLIPDGIPLRQVITWDRLSGFNRTFSYFVPAYEWIFLLAMPGFRINTRSVDDVWRIPFETGGEHPAPFPLKLATRAIGSTDAASVLDPFAGSGTTLVAAKQLGRKAVGIELSERYCEITAKRLAQGVLDLTGAPS